MVRFKNTLNFILNNLDTAIRFLFYPLIVAATFSNAMTEVVTYWIIALWIINKAVKRDFAFTGYRISRMLFLYFICVLFTTLFSNNISLSYPAVFSKLFKNLVICLIAYETFLSSEWRPQKLFIGLFFFIFLDAAFQYFFGFDLVRKRALDIFFTGSAKYETKRIMASFPTANSLAAFLALFLPVLVSIKDKAFSGFTLLLLKASAFVVFIATYSRGAWLGFLASITAFSLLAKKAKALIIPVIFITVLFLLPHTATIKRTLNKRAVFDATTLERIDSFKTAGRLFLKSPLVGVGYNTYAFHIEKMFKDKNPKKVRYAHNSYIQMLSETGIVGNIFFIIFLFFLLMQQLKLSRLIKKYRDDQAALCYALGVGIFAFLIHSLFDNDLFSLTLSLLFWMSAGIFLSGVDKRLKEPGITK
ncbi:MAG: O-antigen ligase family protein [Candidatus Omnitrophica bacterium]|nr:O-antigen ligase family protein [Candidatus Omnitrophota bacterium]MDD5237109.1 O-antigen ligase family protein [Candidatus Omnitrophota bacterium]MDD5610411.1 O-antigen ligase family protein [Candidatus Omnitrophota bacterium]